MWALESTTTVTVAASPVVVYEWAPTCSGHQVLHYSASSGGNVRGGFIHLNWQLNPDGVTWADTSTDSIGVTSTLEFGVTVQSGIGRVLATSTSGTWAVNMLVVAYERSN